MPRDIKLRRKSLMEENLLNARFQEGLAAGYDKAAAEYNESLRRYSLDCARLTKDNNHLARERANKNSIIDKQTDAIYRMKEAIKGLATLIRKQSKNKYGLTLTVEEIIDKYTDLKSKDVMNEQSKDTY